MITIRRLFLVLALLLTGFGAAVAATAAGPAPASEADQLLGQALAERKVAMTPHPELSKLEVWQRFEASMLRFRELGLKFLEQYPADPRRWIVVDGFYPDTPQFVTNWGPLDGDGMPSQRVVDAAAAAAWKAKVETLRAEMAKATDIPDELRKTWAEREQAKQKRGEQRAAFIANARAGKPAPDFVMQDLSGKEVKLADHRGKVVVLDFWAPWCGPCKAAMPHTQEVAAKHKGEGVVVIASCTNDTRENFEKWVKANQANYPDIIWAFDPAAKSDDRASKKLYGVPGIPSQFIIDREGRMVDVVFGYMKGEVILDAALARAGIKVDATTITQAEADWKKRNP